MGETESTNDKVLHVAVIVKLVSENFHIGFGDEEGH